VIIIKKYFEYLGVIGICLLSFYYTEKVALYVKDKSPIMQTIKSFENSKNVNFINSQIIDEIYIIPGLNGRKLNFNKSYSNMQGEKIFDEERLVFNEVIPEVSLENNKDKIIIRGNSKKNSVSLIFENINNLAQYMHQNNYTVNVLINKEEYDFNYEMINNGKTKKVYNNIDSFLSKNKKNNNLCLTNDDTIPLWCEEKYVFKPSLIISHTNISTNKNKIDSGEIILIKDSVNLAELNLIVNYIKYHDFKIVPLSILLNEENK